MKTFQFHSELFEFRARAIDALSQAGFEWFSDFTAIDLDHDRFGLEVCGIHDKSAAIRIQSLLRAGFPTWRYSELWENDWGIRDPGWWVQIHRDPEPEQRL